MLNDTSVPRLAPELSVISRNDSLLIPGSTFICEEGRGLPSVCWALVTRELSLPDKEVKCRGCYFLWRTWAGEHGFMALGTDGGH